MKNETQAFRMIVLIILVAIVYGVWVPKSESYPKQTFLVDYSTTNGGYERMRDSTTGVVCYRKNSEMNCIQYRKVD